MKLGTASEFRWAMFWATFGLILGSVRDYGIEIEED